MTTFRRPNMVHPPSSPTDDDMPMQPLSPTQAMSLEGGAPNNIGMAMQMHAWAQVQSAYYMAQARPRMVAASRQRLLDECKDWRFACEAVWAKPVGRDVKKGLGIRFAEAAALCWTNLKVESTNICETDDLRIIRTTVTDLESNVSYTRDAPVEKFVLRKAPPKLPDGQKAKVWAYNNKGEAQYRVRATADDMLMNQGKEISKSERLLILKHIPKHIQDDCKRALHETLQNKASRGDRKFVLGLLDQFADIKISMEQLETYVGHDPQVLTGLEITMLQGLFYDLADQRVTFDEAMAERHGQPEEDAPRRQLPQRRTTAAAQSAPPAEDAREHEDQVQWQEANPRQQRRQARPASQPDMPEDETSLSEMDLESLDNLGEEDARQVPSRGSQAAPESPTQRVLHALPTRYSRRR